MATILQDSDWAADTARETAAPATAMPNDHMPVKPEWPGVIPERLAVREVTFELGANGLQFFYKEDRPSLPLPRGQIEEVIEELRGGGVALRAALRAAAASTSPPTPLDLNVTGSPIFLIFKLDPELNWHFSRSGPAVTLKDSAHSIFYGGLRHVLGDGTYSPTGGPACKMIYFIANPPAGEYRHGFNLNVELVQDPHVNSEEERFLPIIIDPDIRNPDGSPT